MYDPTIFENLKVVIEGSIYELDDAGIIFVSNRIDSVDLASMSRQYSLEFREKDEAAGDAAAEIWLFTGMEDLAAEILETESRFPGCRLEVRFRKHIGDADQACRQIKQLLGEIWQERPAITQSLSFSYGEANPVYLNRIKLDFGRKINEEQIEDIHGLIDHAIHSLQHLNRLGKDA